MILATYMQLAAPMHAGGGCLVNTAHAAHAGFAAKAGSSVFCSVILEMRFCIHTACSVVRASSVSCRSGLLPPDMAERTCYMADSHFERKLAGWQPFISKKFYMRFGSNWGLAAAHIRLAEHDLHVGPSGGGGSGSGPPPSARMKGD